MCEDIMLTVSERLPKSEGCIKNSYAPQVGHLGGPLGLLAHKSVSFLATAVNSSSVSVPSGCGMLLPSKKTMWAGYGFMIYRDQLPL